ncbi:MAG: pyrroloquinoline quinone biosynthesis protein PqqB [Candidatus Bathyarchaeota archaeon B23]|nr:MAG: pyrroloquinoline quinone biosynthesis protein PqqB [Candidatus Bathyarchaeota archaeon B23]
MRLLILGSGSNGGVPQWDCNCPRCQAARLNPELRRTRSSVAVELVNRRYLLLDATPDLYHQLHSAGLHPGGERRESVIEAVLLTHGHGDHCVGLFELSTGAIFEIPVYGPPDLIEHLFGEEGYFAYLGRLGERYVEPTPLEEGESLELPGGLRAEGFEVPHTDRLEDGSYRPSRTYGYEVEGDGGRLLYIPDIEALTEGVLRRMEDADLVLLDGTFWWEDELLRVSGIDVSSTALGHVPIERSLETLRDVDVGRVIYTHINHTNPLLDPGSRMLGELRRAGFDLAYDGQVIAL